MNFIKVEKAPSPTLLVEVELKQYEDRKVEEGLQQPFLVFRPSTEEPGCYELRTDGGYRRFNAGHMEKLARGLLDMSGTILKTEVYIEFRSTSHSYRAGPFQHVRVSLDDLLDQDGALIATRYKEGWKLQDGVKGHIWSSYAVFSVQR